MERLREAVDQGLQWLVIALMGVNVLNVLWQVFSRYVIGSPSSVTEELARFLLIWVSLLGAAFAVSRRLHLSIDILTMRLKGRNQALFDFLVNSAIFLFALLVMVFGGIRLVTITLALQQISAALQLKLGYVYLVIPLSGLLMMFYSGLFALENLKALRGRPGTT